MIETTSNGKERLYEAIVRSLNRRSYHGHLPDQCLLGQLMNALGIVGLDRRAKLAKRFRVSEHLITRIFMESPKDKYYADPEAALAMARRVLGIGESTFPLPDAGRKPGEPKEQKAPF